MSENLRKKTEELLRGKFSPQNINLGASPIINKTISAFLLDQKFGDDFLTEDFIKGVDDYLANKNLIIFDLNFSDPIGYQLAISSWIDLHFEDKNLLTNNPKFTELMLKTYTAGAKVTYVTYDQDDSIITKKIDPQQNSTILENVSEKVSAAVKSGDYSGIFESTFLSTLVGRGYTYEGFKKDVSKNISDGLKNGSLSVDINLSDDFLDQGPISLVKDGSNMHLSKEFPSHDVTAAKTIPVDKIEKFKEITDWDNTVSVFGMPNSEQIDDGSATTFTKEQINKFADALVGKDLTKNQFLYYTGEIYDDWGSALDSDYWLEVVKVYSDTLLSGYEFAWDTIMGNNGTLASTATISTIGVIQSAYWIAALQAAIPALAFNLTVIGGGSAAAVAATGAAEAAVTASKIGRLASTAKNVLTIVSPKIWFAMTLWTLASIGIALFKAEDIAHKKRLEVRLLNKYMVFLSSAIVSLANDKGIGDDYRSKASDPEFLREIITIFGIDKEVERRVILWNRLSFELSRDENFLDNETAAKAAVDDAIGRAFANIPLPEISNLTDEQIQDRQRFYKQCALMMNLPKLAAPYEAHIIARQGTQAADGPDEKKPFGGRFWRATSHNKEQLITNIFSSEKSQYLFEAPPHIMTQLVPKFRLYKVLNDSSGKLQRTEFVFPMHTDLSRTKNFTKKQAGRSGTVVETTIPSFLEAEFDKGDGVGLKSFTLDFNGTNPAEARNDVKGTMTLFFQSFADFVRERVSYNGLPFSYVDLIVQPKPDDDNKIQGLDTQSLRQYDPSFYRIMVETGYNVPDSLEGIGSDLPNIQSAIKNMNKSFYLCMIDHSFNIKNDGTVEVSLTYRAYVETALKSLRYDALVTPELATQRRINRTKLFELATAKKCTKDQLSDVKKLIAAIETEILQKSLNSIMTRLQNKSKIFTCVIDDGDRRQFLDNGYFRKCDITSDVSNLNKNKANANTGDLGVVLNTRLPEKSSGFDFNDADKNDTIVQYFFFGDLLYTIMDSLYDEHNEGKARGLANTMIVLGSFDFEAFPTEGQEQANSFNISHIPISVEFFSRWFVDNVLSQKSTRKSFPILNFIRSLSNALVSNSMLEACVNRDIEQRLIFQTGQFSSYSADAKDKIGQLIGLGSRNAILDTDNNRLPPTVNGGGTIQPTPLPLEGSPAGDSKIENFFHYIILNANGSTRNHKGVGDYALDIGSGVFHIEIGSNRGLVKTVQFSKTDLQYIREARFMRNGVDGLLQLSSVYSVSIEMFGNTLFYPGMDLWLNPYGFGGTALGHPSTGGIDKKRSLANVLGIGGYHTITGVSTTLTPSSFSTSIKAQYYYSGDLEVGSIRPKTSVPKGLDEQLIEQGVAESTQDAADKVSCNSEIIHLQDVGRGAVVGELQPRAYIPQDEIEAQTSESSSSTTAIPAPANSSASSIAAGDGYYDINGAPQFGEFVEQTDGSMSFEYLDSTDGMITILNAG